MATHETAPTRFIMVKNTTFAYRLFGATSGIPLVFLQHYRGTSMYLLSYHLSKVSGFMLLGHL